MQSVTRLVLLSVVAGAITACQSGSRAGEPLEQKSALSAGGVKITVRKGETTQAQVLEAFGTPDLVTHKDGQEVWTYDKTSYDYESHSSYFNVLIYGQSGDRSRSTSRSTMLMVYFDPRDVVSDYRLSVIKY